MFAGVEVDVFLHTWSLSAHMVGKSHAGALLDSMEHDAARLVKFFGLKNVQVDRLTDEMVAELRRGRSDVPESAVRTLCRAESTRRVFELAERCVGYDLVVLTRPDVVYNARFADLANRFVGQPKVVFAPHLAGLRTGKEVLTKLEKKNPGSVCDWMHDFFNVADPETMAVVVGFGATFLDVVDRFPLPSQPFLPDRALAVYLKNICGLEVKDFNLPHGLQRADKVQFF